MLAESLKTTFAATTFKLINDGQIDHLKGYKLLRLQVGFLQKPFRTVSRHISSLNVRVLHSEPPPAHPGRFMPGASVSRSENVSAIKDDNAFVSPRLNPEVAAIVCERRPPCHGQARQHLSCTGGAGGRPDAGVHRGGSPQESLWLDGWPQQILRKEQQRGGGQHGERSCSNKVSPAVCVLIFMLLKRSNLYDEKQCPCCLSHCCVLRIFVLWSEFNIPRLVSDHKMKRIYWSLWFIFVPSLVSSTALPHYFPS